METKVEQASNPIYPDDSGDSEWDQILYQDFHMNQETKCQWTQSSRLWVTVFTGSFGVQMCMILFDRKSH